MAYALEHLMKGVCVHGRDRHCVWCSMVCRRYMVDRHYVWCSMVGSVTWDNVQNESHGFENENKLMCVGQSKKGVVNLLRFKAWNLGVRDPQYYPKSSVRV